MAVEISSYVDPGVYIQEVIEPGAVSVTTERILAIVGIAPRTRRSLDEPITRGKVSGETLTVAVASPHTATLVNVSNRDRNVAKLYMNNNELGLGDWNFVAAALVGREWGGATINVSVAAGTAQFFTLSLDGLKVVTLNMDAAVTAVGGVPAAATAAKICDAINRELGNPAGTYFTEYGVDYAAVATHATGIANEIITITSPLTTPASDVKVFLSLATANDGASEISNTAWVPTTTSGIQAPSIVQVKDEFYASSATYKIDYVSIEILIDDLLYASSTDPLVNIVRVGSYVGGTSYTKDEDYEKATDDIDWDTTSWAFATLTGINGPFAIVAATNDALSVSVNGRTPITVTLTAGPAQTSTAVALNINTALNNSTVYGPEFSHVASAVGAAVKMIAPDAFESFPQEKGYATTVEFLAVANNAFATVFGTITLPYEVRGTGLRPDFGTGYYVTYDYTRPSADYETAHKVYDPDQLYEYTSPLTIDNYIRNDLCIAGEIAFENQANSIYLVQINDSTTPGTPTPNQIHAAIDVCAEKSEITDVLVLDTSLDTAVYVMEHVSGQCSMLEKHYRRGWYGMARGTDPGDPDTADTFIYRSTRTLQPGGTSPGRGRHFLIAPSEATRTITLDTDQELDVEVDGTYVAASVAAAYTALPSVSSAMVGKTVRGFKQDDFETYERGERHALASKGVWVITLDAGQFKMLDPLSTEAGGAKVVQFEEPASSAQKDIVTKTVDSLIDVNCKGVVPDDLADFLSDIKKWIMLGIEANIIAGNIGPFKDASGFPRDIDPSTDIKVYQSTTDPRSFYFKYWYNLRYPAKRFFGEYSVDNPFFSVE